MGIDLCTTYSCVAVWQEQYGRAKRLIGKKFSDPVVQDDILLWSFKVTAGDNGVDISANSKALS